MLKTPSAQKLVCLKIVLFSSFNHGYVGKHHDDKPTDVVSSRELYSDTSQKAFDISATPQLTHLWDDQMLKATSLAVAGLMNH